jgi:dTDP-4-dehydrorhamnose reductase
VLNAIREIRPEIIYNCAAYTNVDGCESNEKTAYAVNALAVKYLAEAAKEANCVLVHISTDFIFSGQAKEPYTVDAIPDPLTAYGRTKLAGEKFVLEIWPEKSFIIRTAWLYGLRSKNFVETIIRLAKEKDELKVVDDQIGAPTFAEDLVQFLVLLLDSRGYGIYHYTNQGQTSRYDFARYFLHTLNYKTKLSVCKTADFPRPAHVPAYSVLDLTKTEKQFKIRIPDWQDGMDRYLEIRE